MATCEIKWIDGNGNSTADTNPAIGRVRCKGHIEQVGGRAIEFGTSQWFHTCEEHAKRMNDPGMHNWEWEK